MKFSLCVDDSEYIRKEIEKSISGVHNDWQFGCVLDHVTPLIASDGSKVNVIHLTGSLVSFLRYKWMYFTEHASAGCFRGWTLERK